MPGPAAELSTGTNGGPLPRVHSGVLCSNEHTGRAADCGPLLALAFRLSSKQPRFRRNGPSVITAESGMLPESR